MSGEKGDRRHASKQETNYHLMKEGSGGQPRRCLPFAVGCAGQTDRHGTREAKLRLIIEALECLMALEYIKSFQFNFPKASSSMAEIEPE